MHVMQHKKIFGCLEFFLRISRKNAVFNRPTCNEVRFNTVFIPVNWSIHPIPRGLTLVFSGVFPA